MASALFFNAVALACAICLALWVRPRPLALVPASVVILHVLVIQTWVLASGLAGRLDVGSWWAIGLGLMVLLPVAWQIRRIRHLNELGRWWKRAAATARVLGPLRLGLGLLGLACIGLVVGLAGWMGGPLRVDVMSYHLAPATDWIAEGSISSRPWHDARSHWPQGHGLLAAWWMLPTGSLRAVIGAEFHWMGLALTAIWALARQMGAGPRQAWMGLLLAAAVPILWAQGSAGLNDLAISALALFSVAACCGYRSSRSAWVMGLVALIMGLGVKPTMLILAPAILLAALWRSRIKPVWSCDIRPGPAPTLVLVIGLALATASIWYIQSGYQWGNPLYPASVRLGDRVLLEGHPVLGSAAGRIGFDQLSRNIVDLFWYKNWDRNGFQSGLTDGGGAGFGLMAGALGWPAAIGLGLLVRRSRRPLAAIGLMVLALGLCIGHDPYTGRFYSFLPLFFALCIAMVLPRLRPRPCRIVWGGLMVLSLVGTASSSLFHVVIPTARLYYQEQGFGRVPLTYLDSDPAFGQAIEELPDTGPLVVLWDPTLAQAGKGYPTALLHGPDLRRRLIYIHRMPEASILQEWRKAGVHWLFVAMPESELADLNSQIRDLGLTIKSRRLYEIP